MLNKSMKPTKSDLEILDVLWERGQATVREVYEILNARNPTGYTTILKLMQIMSEKGLVTRDVSSRAHIYRAARPQHETQKNLVADLLEKAFRGSALKLVQHVLETKPTSAEELKQIRELISDAQKKLSDE